MPRETETADEDGHSAGRPGRSDAGTGDRGGAGPSAAGATANARVADARVADADDGADGGDDRAATLPILQVVEPNLAGPSGHYAEFIRALAARAGGFFDRFDLLAHPKAGAFLPTLSGEATVRVADCAPRREMSAIRAALRAGRPTLVLTATARHALAADRGGLVSARDLSHLALFVHWPLARPASRLALAMAARARRESLFLAPTRGVRAALEEAGCARVRQVAYPATRAPDAPMRRPFRHLLMAGAARINKGLDVVAELAERYARELRDLPLLVQVSPKHVTRHGAREGIAVDRLLAARYDGLRADPKAPDRDEYAARFAGALVLAPYERAKFADGVSGVVLDALLHGAPVVATEGTWAGDVVERFGAGIALRERTGDALATAVDRILGRWDRFAAAAAEASDALAEEHDPRRLARILATQAG